MDIGDPPDPPKPDPIPELPSANTSVDESQAAASARELAKRRRGRSQLTVDPATAVPTYGTGISIPK